VVDPEALAPVLRDLVQALGSRSRRPLVSLGGIHPVVRVLNLPRLKRDMLMEAINGEMRRELPSSIEHYQIHWLPIESSKTQVRVYVLAVPANELESYMLAFRAARLRPRSINLEGLALASILGREDGIIIGIKDDGFSIVAAREGIPAVMRDISYAQEGLSTSDRAADLGRELQFTLASFASDQEGTSAGPALATYLVGPEGTRDGINEYLSREIGLTATRLELPVEYPPDFPAAAFAANVGLALGNQGRRRFHAGKPRMNFDLIPPEYQPRTVPLAQGVLLILVVVGLVSVINPLQDALQPNAEEVRLSSEVAQYQARIDEAREQVRQSRELEASRAEAEARARQLDIGLQEMAAERLIWTAVIQDAQAAFPEVELLTFAENADRLTISARAPSATQVVDFTNYLSDIGRFASVNLQSLGSDGSAASDARIRFDLVASKGGS
jgi:Tfp pilus assembly protein PilN